MFILGYLQKSAHEEKSSFSNISETPATEQVEEKTVVNTDAPVVDTDAPAVSDTTDAPKTDAPETK